jgi:hypothetical protein
MNPRFGALAKLQVDVGQSPTRDLKKSKKNFS